MMKWVTTAAILGILASVCIGQKTSDTWLRVLTEDDYVIDVNKNSIVLVPGPIIRADFRTSFPKPEPIDQEPTMQYSSRIDSIEFAISKSEYRLVENSFIDSAGNVVLKVSNSEQGWKRRNQTSIRFYSAASKLAPFGHWKVISYRYASGEAPSKDDAPELQALVGKTIVIGPAYLFIGNSNCPGATLDFRPVSDKDLTRYGLSLKDLGIDSLVSVILASCPSDKNYPEPIGIFLESSSKARLLWNGVFYDIVRPPNVFSP